MNKGYMFHALAFGSVTVVILLLLYAAHRMDAYETEKAGMALGSYSPRTENIPSVVCDPATGIYTYQDPVEMSEPIQFDPTSLLHYDDKVLIVAGFHRGAQGTVVDRREGMQHRLFTEYKIILDENFLHIWEHRAKLKLVEE